VTATIRQILAREVLDSRGNPTVEVDVITDAGHRGRAIVPSGASTGTHEAVELRDGDPLRYGGKGVRRAVGNVRDVLTPRCLGLPLDDQRRIDETLIAIDGTPDKSRLGANAILGVSLACAHAAAASCGLPLWQFLAAEGAARMPLPMVNLISGGLHAGKNLAFQDFLFLPIGARSYSESLEMTSAVYRALANVLTRHGHEAVLVGDEGGFGPKLGSNRAAVETILETFEMVGLTAGREAAIALDVASTHFYDNGAYTLEGSKRSSSEMVEMLSEWSAAYPILSIEDGLAEDDWSGWTDLTRRLGDRIHLIGDDLFTTDRRRLQRGIDIRAANCILVKINQIGTLTEALDVWRLAKSAGYRAVISARSGETEDATLADLAVATGAGQIKIGSIARGERLAKYNQLLRIEEQMGGPEAAPFARWQSIGSSASLASRPSS
jgi:enolase